MRIGATVRGRLKLAVRLDDDAVQMAADIVRAGALRETGGAVDLRFQGVSQTAAVLIAADGRASTLEFGTLATPARPWAESTVRAARKAVAAKLKSWFRITRQG